MQQIFISYSRKEEDIVHQLANALKEADISVWLDVWNIATGENWRDAIQRGLDECSMMLLVITPDAMESEQVSLEWHYYLDEGKPIIPILLKPTKIHFQIRPLQYVDFQQLAFEDAFVRLLQVINEKHEPDLDPRDAQAYEILRSAYRNWLNFDRDNTLLLDRNRIQLILDKLLSYNGLTDSLWRFILTSIASYKFPVREYATLINALKSLDSETTRMIFDPLLVHPNRLIRQNTISLIAELELTDLIVTLEQCIVQETNEDTLINLLGTLISFDVEIMETTLRSIFERMTTWYNKSRLLNMIETETKSVLIVSDGTELAYDFQQMLQDVGFSPVEITPKDFFGMQVHLPELPDDILMSYHLVVLIRGEHYSTTSQNIFYKRLIEYVLNGGTLFASAWVGWESKQNAVLADILPFKYHQFNENVILNCVPTKEGIAENLFTEAFTILSSCEVLSVKDKATVLLGSTSNNPIFGYRYIGEGRTFYLNSCQHSCTSPFEAQTRSSKAFREAFERVFKWVYESV